MTMRASYAAFAAVMLLALAAAGPLLLARTESSLVQEVERDWRDPQRLALAGHDATLLLSRHPTLDPVRDALVIDAPAVGYTAEEALAIRAFVREGGHLLVVGDRGAGKELLDALDVGIRLSGVSLYSPVFDGSPDRMIARSTGRIAALPAEIIVTRPVAVMGGEGVLLAPEPTWEDVNDNEKPDLEERVVSAAVAAVATFGEGGVLVVGDRDALDDLGAPAPQAFLRWVTDGDRRLVIDEAHRTRSDPFSAHSVLSGNAGPVVGTAIFITALAVGASVVLAPRLRATPKKRVSRPGKDMDPRDVREVLSELDAR